MKTSSLLCAAIALLFSINAFAQMDEREPGLYAIVNGESTALSSITGIKSNSGTAILGFEIGETKYKYRGDHAETAATDTFVMVIDPEKSVITQSLRKYNPFIKTMTPDNIIIVPLTVEKNKRIYAEGTTVNGFNTERKTRMSFEWEQTADNAFTITTEKLEPGEYGIAFKPAKLGAFEFSSIFVFFVAE